MKQRMPVLSLVSCGLICFISMFRSLNEAREMLRQLSDTGDHQELLAVFGIQCGESLAVSASTLCGSSQDAGIERKAQFFWRRICGMPMQNLTRSPVLRKGALRGPLRLLRDEMAGEDNVDRWLFGSEAISMHSI